jgi:hypothetical protein
VRVSVEVDVAAARAAAGLFRAALRVGVPKGLDQAGQKIENDLKRAAPVKSGRLRQSLGYRVTPANELEVGSLTGAEALVYARQVEFGGQITGRPFLAIPLPKSGLYTKAGVGGIRARDVRSSPGQFGYTSTFVQRSRAGNLLIFGRSPGKGKLTPLFVLKESVTQKGKPYLYPTVEKDLPMVADEIARAVDAAAGGKA